MKQFILSLFQKTGKSTVFGYIILLVLFSLMITVAFVDAQDFNPPYPRIGGFTFTTGVNETMEAHVDILKDFDIICFPSSSSSALAHKALKPDRPILATSGCFWAYQDSETPEGWFYHKVDGSLIPLFNNYYLMNLTTLCPYEDLGDGHGPKRFVDHCLDLLPEDIDFTIFDGVFFDWSWTDPGWTARNYGDLDRNGVVDKEEWGEDSVITVWQDALLFFYEAVREIPGCDYVIKNGAVTWQAIYPLVNGFNWEDWPTYNGPWSYWRQKYNDEKTDIVHKPRFMLMGAGHRHFHRAFPIDPYKNNFRAVRFAFSSNLLTGAYIYVDEGNEDYGPGGPGHHGNQHFYDEFEAKGKLGYPVSDMIMIPDKLLSSGSPYAEGVWVRYFDHGVSVVNATGLEQTVSASELAAHDPVSGSLYYRFRGGQDPVFNNGEAVTDADPLILWGDIAIASWKDPEVFGEGSMLFRKPMTLITPIIVDNNENNQTSPGSEPVQYVGTWDLTSDGEKYYAFYNNRDYGPFQPYGHAWCNAGSGENTARYTPTIGLPGYYEVFEWHGYRGTSPSVDQSSDVPAKIVYDQGKRTSVTIDQTQNFGQWNSLGTFLFRSGTNGYVELNNNTSGIVISDAIKFEFRAPDETLDLEAPSSPQGVNVER